MARPRRHAVHEAQLDMPATLAVAAEEVNVLRVRFYNRFELNRSA
jgi:hypothetical protein